MSHARFFSLILLLIAAGTCHTQGIPAEIEKLVERLFSRNAPDEVRASTIPGIYEVRINGKVLFIDGDRKFLVDGMLFDLESGQDLSAASLMRLRRETLEKITPHSWVQFTPEKTRYVLYVFTDVDCHFCRKFHSHIDELLELGIEVRYLFAPFRGENARARAIGVWCASNPRTMMTQAKQGKDVPLRQCANPVEKHLAIVRKLGIEGTPHIILSNGHAIPGYLEPHELIRHIKRAGVKPLA